MSKKKQIYTDLDLNGNKLLNPFELDIFSKYKTYIENNSEDVALTFDEFCYKLSYYITELESLLGNKISLPNPLGDGNKFLSDDGTYKTIKTSSGSGGSTEASTKGGVILFETEVSHANYEDVTLFQSADNYSQLDICCCTDVGETVFISVYNPNNSIANVSSLIQESGELIIKSKQYEIRNDTILTVSGIGGMASVSSNGIVTTEGNYIGIYKVIGYN